MRVLVVSWFFPPANTMGALRVGKFVDFLIRQNHDVCVITADFLTATPPLDDVPSCHVLRTGWWDVNALPRWAARLLKNQKKRTSNAPAKDMVERRAPANHSEPRPTQRLTNAYVALTNFPDKRVGWIPHAVRAGRRALSDFDADVVFASAPPFSAAVAGALLARWAGKPYVIEMRDRFSDDPYRAVSGVRGRIERVLERWVMRKASGIVTVSQPWARQYEARDKKPAVAVLNGYDPDDIRHAAALPGRPSRPGVLVISHVGRIYPGRRDPSALFEAIRGLDDNTRACIRVEFVGENQGIAALAGSYGIKENVVLFDPLPYLEALRHQMDSDIVLLLQWNDPAEQGNVPGKLFEYLATRRPILGHGFDQGVPATIIRAQSAGLYSNDPSEIRHFLVDKLAEKWDSGVVSANPPSVCEGFDRGTAYDKLTRFLEGTTVDHR